MTEILKERWMKLANILKESDECMDEACVDECGSGGVVLGGEPMEEQRLEDMSGDEDLDDVDADEIEVIDDDEDDDDSDHVPGASAWGHGGDWEEHFDSEREAGNENAHKSLKQLKDEGYGEDEILELLRDL